jgi:Mn2+/Fe2+ NRAMP family transporter
MFIFKVITAIFWLAISFVWSENIYNEVSDQPIFREIVALFCYGFAICYAIEMLFARVKWLQLILFMVIFSIMSAAGCKH